jgi:hypothetical protein
MFWTVFPLHRQEFKTVHTATGICQTDTDICLPASEFKTVPIPVAICSLELLTMRRKDRQKHVECYSKIK